MCVCLFLYFVPSNRVILTQKQMKLKQKKNIKKLKRNAPFSTNAIYIYTYIHTAYTYIYIYTIFYSYYYTI